MAKNLAALPTRTEIAALANLSDAEIGRRFGRSAVWACHLRNRLGIAKRGRSVDPAALPPPRRLHHGERPPMEEIGRLVSAGLTDAEIAARYGREHKWAAETRQRYGIPSAYRRGELRIALGPPINAVVPMMRFEDVGQAMLAAEQRLCGWAR